MVVSIPSHFLFLVLMMAKVAPYTRPLARPKGNIIRPAGLNWH